MLTTLFLTISKCKHNYYCMDQNKFFSNVVLIYCKPGLWAASRNETSKSGLEVRKLPHNHENFNKRMMDVGIEVMARILGSV